jgi:hypothetical protein
MGTERPILDKNTDPEIFTEYYYLKEELASFCRDNGLQMSGIKSELTERVHQYLLTGEKLVKDPIRKRTLTQEITLDAVIGPDVVCSEKLRGFFKDNTERSFKFNAEFLKWLRSNPERTYRDAVTAFYDIKERKKKGKSVIGRQFEYNTYIRDFFADNPGRTLDDAVRCWRYRKGLPGSNRYEEDDLSILER